VWWRRGEFRRWRRATGSRSVGYAREFTDRNADAETLAVVVSGFDTGDGNRHGGGLRGKHTTLG
jgi:hypothetical protein